MKKTIVINFDIYNFDIYNIQKKFLERKFLLKLIEELVRITKSKHVGKPVVNKISSPKYNFSGYSILQIIQESHIAFHTWPEYNYLAIDIFSCKKVQAEKIIDFLKKNLNKEVEIKIKEYKRVARF
jgi:S-adenosylmethionine/arginine decarboxylase-like enzyme